MSRKLSSLSTKLENLLPNLMKNNMSEKLTLKKWLPPDKPKNRKSRVVIYDFDGTIFKSPHREQGETVYFEYTGQMLPFPGWWGRIETLMPPIVPQNPELDWYIESTINAFRKDSKDSETECVLMTGRPFKIRKRVIEICENQNLKFDAHYFRGQPGSKGRDTLEIKNNLIVEHVVHQGLKVIEIHEDRPEHVSGFIDIFKRLKREFKQLEKILVHDVVLSVSHEI